MKKLLSFLLLLCLTLPLFAACGGEITTVDTSSSDSVSTEGAVSDSPSSTEEPDPPTSPSFNEEEHARLEKSEDGAKAVITSLDGAMVMTVSADADGNYSYTLTHGEDSLVNPSALNIQVGTTTLTGASLSALSAKHINASYPFLGNFSTLTDDCVAATLTLDKDGYTFYMEIKLYDNGVAFRYRLPDTGARRTVKSEVAQFALPAFDKVFCGKGSDCYESEIAGYTYNRLSTNEKLNGPMTFELSEGKGYLVLLEGYVAENYIGTNFVSTGSNNTFAISGSWTNGTAFDAFSAAGEICSGWRMVNYAPDLAGIVTNVNIYHTTLGMDGVLPEHGDTSYVTPGKSVWSWINDRGVPFEPQIEYTLNAARLGFLYNIIDEGYPSWTDSEASLLQLGRMGEELGVKQLLWCYATGGHNGYQIGNAAQAKSILAKISSLHLAGVKLDFFNPETRQATLNLQRAVLEAAIQNKLVVNFHGAAKPTGLSAVYPNELSREGIRGLENMARENLQAQARYFTSQYYTRYLAGHADFTPDVNTAMQIASLVFLDSPLMVIATDPVDMLKSPARELIKAIPTVWDRTVFLDGAIGSYLSVAKEASGVWYIGGVTVSSRKNISIDLSFLGEGSYLLTGFVDKSTSQKVKIEQLVTSADAITIDSLPAACGYVFQLTKLSLSQYGGEIGDPITVTTASDTSVVKYTLDGSDPMTSSTALSVEGGKITLRASCTLRVAIVSGDGAGTALSCHFSDLSYNGVTSKLTYENGSTTLTLTAGRADAKLYYTLDGSEPTASSTLYTAPLTFTKKTVVSVVAIAPDGAVSTVYRYTVAVRTSVSALVPDIYLGSDYVSATTDWGSPYVDKSMNNTTLSLGGTTSSNGTKFSHGISANANAAFVYNIPQGASRFVGMAGIDDSVYNNAADNHKASIVVSVYVDGKLLAQTARLTPGEFEQIDIALPEGAKQIRIVFGDAGDGITCDNAALVNAGFMR